MSWDCKSDGVNRIHYHSLIVGATSYHLTLSLRTSGNKDGGVASLFNYIMVLLRLTDRTKRSNNVEAKAETLLDVIGNWVIGTDLVLVYVNTTGFLRRYSLTTSNYNKISSRVILWINIAWWRKKKQLAPEPCASFKCAPCAWCVREKHVFTISVFWIASRVEGLLQCRIGYKLLREFPISFAAVSHSRLGLKYRWKSSTWVIIRLYIIRWWQSLPSDHSWRIEKARFISKENLSRLNKKLLPLSLAFSTKFSDWDWLDLHKVIWLVLEVFVSLIGLQSLGLGRFYFGMRQARKMVGSQNIFYSPSNLTNIDLPAWMNEDHQCYD